MTLWQRARRWRVAATIVATAAVYIGKRALVGPAPPGTTDDDESSSSDSLLSSSSEGGRPHHPIGKRKRSFSNNTAPFMRFLFIPASIILCGIAFVSFSIVLRKTTQDNYLFPSNNVLLLWSSSTKVIPLFLTIVLCQELLILLPFLLYRQKRLSYFRTIVLDSVIARGFLINLHLSLVPIRKALVVIMLCYIGVTYWHHSVSISSSRTEFYMLLGMTDLILLSVTELLHTLVRGDASGFFALESQRVTRPILSFRRPSLLVIRWTTMLYNWYLPSSISNDNDVITNSTFPSSKILFVSNQTLLNAGLPMLVRSLYESAGIYPRVLLDPIWFKVPFFASVMGLLGAVKLTSSSVEALLEAGEPILLTIPGAFTHSISTVQIDILSLALELGYRIVPVTTSGVDSNFKTLTTLGVPWWMNKSSSIEKRIPILLPVAPWNLTLVSYKIGTALSVEDSTSKSEIMKAVETATTTKEVLVYRF